MNKTEQASTAPIIGIHVLGCDKNAADAEQLAGLLVQYSAGRVRIVRADLGAPIPPLAAVIVYTCAFILDAKTESISALLEWCQRRERDGQPARIYGVGCLTKRYADELPREMPEVDGIFGVEDHARLARQLTASLFPRRALRKDKEPAPSRILLDNAPHAFLKIGDGCDHACTFCAIPGIKGRLYSKPREAVLAEARLLLDQGVRELNLVAQDTSAYGRDRYENYRLADLLRDLCALDGDFWIRCLYVYPNGIDNALIEQLATQPKAVPYLDIPLQHVSPRMLSAMGRPARQADTLALVSRLRRAIPDLTLRTTMLVGFPGESDDDHQMMLEVLQEAAFEWLGAFIFSPEEGTPAAKMRGKIPKRTARERYNALMELQAEITARFNQERVGQRTRVLVERFDADLNAWTSRSRAEAPEVDGSILLHQDVRIQPGMFVEAELEEACLYDVTGRAVFPRTRRRAQA